ncbi:flavodoxin-like fold domain-containing protein [Ditylenchus destructor]|nr:flavodoxin-like fold domain-containing protein [Ditylenchus destructor]
MAQVALADSREGELAGSALQQARAEAFFQLGDPPRQSRLGNSQQPAGGSEATGFHDFGEYILGDNSASRQLSAGVVKAWQAAEPGVEVTYRDVAAEGLNHFSGATLGALGTPADQRSAAQQHEAELSAKTLAEFLAADAVVIAAPMYNFTIPTQLKAWIDRIAVAGQTFRYTEAGPEGLAATRKSSLCRRRAACMSAKRPVWPMKII